MKDLDSCNSRGSLAYYHLHRYHRWRHWPGLKSSNWSLLSCQELQLWSSWDFLDGVYRKFFCLPSKFILFTLQLWQLSYIAQRVVKQSRQSLEWSKSLVSVSGGNRRRRFEPVLSLAWAICMLRGTCVCLGGCFLKSGFQAILLVSPCSNLSIIERFFLHKVQQSVAHCTCFWPSSDHSLCKQLLWILLQFFEGGRNPGEGCTKTRSCLYREEMVSSPQYATLTDS